MGLELRNSRELLLPVSVQMFLSWIDQCCIILYNAVSCSSDSDVPLSFQTAVCCGGISENFLPFSFLQHEEGFDLPRPPPGRALRRHIRTIREVRTVVTRLITDIYYKDGAEVERKVVEVRQEMSRPGQFRKPFLRFLKRIFPTFPNQ